ncbi:MAG: hypothetical protein ACRBDX_09535 [Gammaproteobacteria bacterium]
MNNKEKINLGNVDESTVPPLNEELDKFLQPGVHEALVEFTTQAQIYFPQILNDERDQAAAKIHLDNLQEHINSTNQLNIQTSPQDSEKIATALKSLSIIGDKKQDDMMACALLDYIDEILEMLPPQI